MNNKIIKLFKLIAFLITLSGIVTSYIGQMVDVPEKSLFMTIVHSFCYFTMWTNFLLAAYFFITCFLSDFKIGVCSNMSHVKSALLLYIFFVGTGYHFLLSMNWEPEGFTLLAANILHYLTPILMLIDWLLVKPSTKIKFKYTVLWLIYPTAYAFFTIIRGSVTGHYTYYFFHVGDLGFVQVLINIIGFLCVFLILGNLIAIITNFRLNVFK